MLLYSPGYNQLVSLPLFVPGDASCQQLAFSKPVVLWASPANPGAAELGNELVAIFPGLAISTAEVDEDASSSVSTRPSSAHRTQAHRAGDVTHMLLYLTESTWSEDDGERLAEQVKQARSEKLPIVMAHENDPALGGIAFNHFFETTPQELIDDGLYRDLARAFFPGVYREAPQALRCRGGGGTRVSAGAGVSLGVARASGEAAGRHAGQGTVSSA